MPNDQSSETRAQRDWSELSEEAIIEQEPTRARKLLYAVLISISLLIVWSALAGVDTVTRGTGKVIPSSQVQIIGSQDGGIVQQILVSEGELVEQGQLLLSLDRTRSEASLGENQAELRGLQIRALRLDALASGRAFLPDPAMVRLSPQVFAEELELFETSKEEFETLKLIAIRQKRQREEELIELEAKRDQLVKESSLARNELNVTRPLVASGAASQVEIFRLEREVNRATGELRQVRAGIRGSEAAVQEATSKIETVRLEFLNRTREKLAETYTQIASRSQAGEGLSDRVNQTDVVAPVTGTIKQLHYNTVGGVVLPGRDIVELIPADDTLLLEVKIKPKDIAFLAPGQEANVKLTAYDFVVYGGMEGVIEQIGADTILDSNDEPYYEVTVRTREVDFGPDQPIIPGMTVNVDILTGRKTVLSYLMKPVLRAQQRALSER
ncbi:HlyD family type I secretion periplasmic adaptor subunit [Luminiphilus sp.]|nr:HlyD family type I secretion periplasmic adaptor subunit [Luminiphilus sp.]